MITLFVTNEEIYLTSKPVLSKIPLDHIFVGIFTHEELYIHSASSRYILYISVNFSLTESVCGSMLKEIESVDMVGLYGAKHKMYPMIKYFNLIDAVPPASVDYIYEDIWLAKREAFREFNSRFNDFLFNHMALCLKIKNLRIIPGGGIKKTIPPNRFKTILKETGAFEKWCNSSIYEFRNEVKGNYQDNWLYLDVNFYNYFNRCTISKFTKQRKDLSLEGTVAFHKNIGINERCIANIHQLKNIYPSVEWDGSELYFNGCKYSPEDFRNLFLESFPTIRVIEDNLSLKANDNIVILTSANQDIARGVLGKYDSLRSGTVSGYSICLTYVNGKDHSQLISYIRHKFKSFAIFQSQNFGTDIIPFVDTYRYLHRYAFKGVLKLHTKTNDKWREIMLSKLIKNPAKFDKYACSCVSKNDKFCRQIIEDQGINIQGDFCPGTMFYESKETMDRIIYHRAFQNVYHQSVIQTMYYDNESFLRNSPVHALERLFGYLKDV